MILFENVNVNITFVVYLEIELSSLVENEISCLNIKKNSIGLISMKVWKKKLHESCSITHISLQLDTNFEYMMKQNSTVSSLVQHHLL